MTNWGAEAANLNENFDKVSTAIEQVKNATIKSKGYFSSESALKLAIPTAAKGDKAYVGNNYPYQIWIWNGSSWGDSGSVGGEESVNLGNYHTKEYTDAKLSELGSGILDLQLILQSESNDALLQGQSQAGYINADSGFLFLIETDKSVYYVPCSIGDVFDVFIPKTSNFGSVIGFSDKVETNTLLLAYGVNNVANNIEYSGIVESGYNGYLIVAYMTEYGMPVIKKKTVSSDVLSAIEESTGKVVAEGTDVSVNIKKSNSVYILSEKRYKDETIYASKNNIPINLIKTDYIYKSRTGVPNNANLFAFFDKDFNLLCGSINTTGAYVKETNIRQYVPQDFWEIVKYVSINCYSTSIEEANLELIVSSSYNEESDKPYLTAFDHLSGEPIKATLKTLQSGSLCCEFVEVDLAYKVYSVCSGYFNKYAPDNGIKFYDGLKRLMKEVVSQDINYVVVNDDGNIETNFGVCLNNYISEDEKNKVRYVTITCYRGGVDIENSFLNTFYVDNVVLNKVEINTYTGKKLLTYGDSVTEGKTWQNQLASMKGMEWNADDCDRLDSSDTLYCKSSVYHYEVSSGENKNKVCFKRDDGSYYFFTDDGQEVSIDSSAMAEVRNRTTGLSGSFLGARPQEGLNYRCVHKRIQESQSFGADVILVYGTYNDVLVGRTDSENLAYYGTIEDKPYYGLAKEGVTFSASLKGIFEILARTCPYAKVVYVGVYTFVNNSTSKEEWDSSYNACKYQNDIAKEICSQYGIPFVDLQKNFGCTWYNHMKFMSNSSPHPNQYGADRTAEIIAASI